MDLTSAHSCQVRLAILPHTKERASKYFCMLFLRTLRKRVYLTPPCILYKSGERYSFPITEISRG